MRTFAPSKKTADELLHQLLVHMETENHPLSPLLNLFFCLEYLAGQLQFFLRRNGPGEGVSGPFYLTLPAATLAGYHLSNHAVKIPISIGAALLITVDTI